MVCRRYRPRQPRASPVWQVFKEHWLDYMMRQEAGTSVKHGQLAAHIPSAVTAFLRCGDLHAGFTRLRCPDCRHEYLLAFTCKQRGLCAACHQRRVLTEAPFIADEVCADVPHRHLVLTIPRLLRGHFVGKPVALSELALAARDALTAWLRDRTGCPTGQPGLVMVVQTFGDFLLWHPHVHVLVTAGVFGPDGHFHLAPHRRLDRTARALAPYGHPPAQSGWRDHRLANRASPVVAARRLYPRRRSRPASCR